MHEVNGSGERFRILSLLFLIKKMNVLKARKGKINS